MYVKILNSLSFCLKQLIDEDYVAPRQCDYGTGCAFVYLVIKVFFYCSLTVCFKDPSYWEYRYSQKLSLKVAFAEMFSLWSSIALFFHVLFLPFSFKILKEFPIFLHVKILSMQHVSKVLSDKFMWRLNLNTMSIEQYTCISKARLTKWSSKHAAFLMFILVQTDKFGWQHYIKQSLSFQHQLYIKYAMLKALIASLM